MSVDAVAIAILHRLGSQLWGFEPRLMSALVERGGAVRTLAWFAGNMPRYERTLKAFGPLRTHLVTTTISLVNGCEYCAYGHGYAFDLVHLRDRGAAFPRSAAELLALCGRPVAQIRAELADALSAADLVEEIAWVDRVLTVHAAPTRPTDAEGARLAHLVDMFAVLNGTGIACAVAPDEAHDPVNKNTALKDRLATIRA